VNNGPVTHTVVALFLLAAFFNCFGCDSKKSSDGVVAHDGLVPRAAVGDPAAQPVSGGDSTQRLETLFSQIGFLPYLDIRPISQGNGDGGFTDYYFKQSDMCCFRHQQMNIAVSYGSSDNVVLFMDGGGAIWPGGGLMLSSDDPLEIPILERTAENPLRDWNYVYVPYCDGSLHLGDNIYEYDWGEGHHQGLRQTAAAVALMKKLFPHAPKVLIAGLSAGGFGTLYGWAIAKSQYMDAETYVLSDGGVGFWNPNDLTMWQTMSTAWNLHLPPACEKCDGPIMTYLYETYMDLDPQVRVGLFSSYRDRVMCWFTGLSQAEFRQYLLSITGEIKQAHADRFGRFFIKGVQHTSGSDGLATTIGGVSYGDWIERMIYDDAPWNDELE
jgi:hypothetical protein